MNEECLFTAGEANGKHSEYKIEHTAEYVILYSLSFLTSVYSNGYTVLFSMACFPPLYRALAGFFKHCLTQHLIPSEVFYFLNVLFHATCLEAMQGWYQ